MKIKDFNITGMFKFLAYRKKGIHGQRFLEYMRAFRLRMQERAHNKMVIETTAKRLKKEAVAQRKVKPEVTVEQKRRFRLVKLVQKMKAVLDHDQS